MRNKETLQSISKNCKEAVKKFSLEKKKIENNRSNCLTHY